MATVSNTLTPEEYLRLERASLEKHEYVDRQMPAMAGANRQHRTITDNIRFALRVEDAASGCVSDNSATRLFIPATGGYTYPDVVMTCGELQRFRTMPFNSYTSIPSFLEYMLVSQDEVLVEQRVRLAPQEWRTRFDSAKL